MSFTREVKSAALALFSIGHDADYHDWNFRGFTPPFHENSVLCLPRSRPLSAPFPDHDAILVLSLANVCRDKTVNKPKSTSCDSRTITS